MNEKKSNGFAALILSLVVVVVAVLAVKFAGGTAAANAVKPGPGPEVTPGESDAAPAAKYGAGTYTATAQGMGKVTVTVTVDTEKIVDIQIDASGETPGLGDKAAEKLKGIILDAQSAEVDNVSGASMTSGAVKTAVADCLAQAEAAAGSGAAEGEGEAAGAYKPGTYTASAQGMGKVTVTITVDETGAIANVEIDASGETPGLGDKAAEKLVDKILAAQSAEFDGISGASMTSGAVKTAVADCLAQAAN